MKIKIPVLKKCCFCMPLRHGLIAWGCFKMIADAFLITFLSMMLMQEVMMVKVLSSDDDILGMLFAELLIPVIALTAFVVDFVVALMFVCSPLEKKLWLTQAFYFVSIAMWIFSLLVTATFVVVELPSATDNFEAGFSFYILILVVQTYFLILLRSEIIHLKNSGESRSQDNVAEEESTKKCEEIVAGEEAGKEIV